MKLSRIIFTAVIAWVLGISAAQAAPIMHVVDNQGRLGRVDVATGAVSVIGNTGAPLTDIAFSPSGSLYGLSFTNLYRINPLTGVVTSVGRHGIPGGNALVFGANGTLYAAGFSTTSLFKINPSTGAATSLGNTGFKSAGDLSFKNGILYLSSTTNQLVRINLANPANSVAVGPFGFTDVFGLATGNNSVLYGVFDTKIFTVNTATGHGTLVSNYGGRGLGKAFGATFRLARVQFSKAAYSVKEGVGTAIITVTRSGSTAGADSVHYATSNGTAVANSDYTPRSGALTFATGVTAKTFTVPITNDRVREPNETVRLTLNNPAGGATLGAPNKAVLTILNDD